LRRWSADFQLRAHLLNLRCLSFELRRENFHFPSPVPGLCDAL
jgi:hypothetical protein